MNQTQKAVVYSAIAAAAGIGIAGGVIAYERAHKPNNGVLPGGTTGTTGTAAGASLAIPEQPLGAMRVGVVFSHRWTTTGGNGQAVTWRVSAGALPPGLSLSTTGVLAGTPTQAGPFTFTVQANDGGAAPAARSTTVTVAKAASTLAIPTQSLGAMQAGKAYSYRWRSTGGASPVVWSLYSGALPPGLTLAENGVMSGTPTKAGPYAFVVQATDANRNVDRRSTPVTVAAGSSAVAAAAGATTYGSTSTLTAAQQDALTAAQATGLSDLQRAELLQAARAAGGLTATQTAALANTNVPITQQVAQSIYQGQAVVESAVPAPVYTPTFNSPAPTQSVPGTPAPTSNPAPTGGLLTPAQQLALSKQANGGKVVWVTLPAGAYNPYTGGYGGRAPAA